MRRALLIGLLLGFLLSVPSTQAQQPPWGFTGARVKCSVVNNSATTLTAFGGSCAAPGTGFSIYITEITASASVISTTTADQYLEIKSGTGGACGSATAVEWAAFSLAFDNVHATFNTAIKVPANSELCWMHAAAGNKTFIVSGYIAQ